ncbi:acyltransferase family protein [Actinophytocola oryzae]|uniref:Peptidoglycan/LPS O-acetylase OafA/YrhL n=1 Tax=Actinophytocola oryzae TaxID=502181 RepID=A0A4V3FTE0_9PSEU|nr:acyltransferase [Actinophytocola oryzae]TDV50891.1 peptidoglycan/LPS O-acetylase OafA/YrhL [Actinophytocola oryzae]
MSGGYLHGLNALRIVASVAVVYDHFRGWFASGQQRWTFDEKASATVFGPLRLDSLVGAFGIGTFFIVSGVVITYAAQRESPGRFVARRAVRILPAMWVVLLAVWVVARTNTPIGVTGPVTVGDLFANLTLANFFFSGNAGLDLVTWTLAVQISYYVFVAATIPLLRRWPWLPPALAVTMISVLLSVLHDDGVATHMLRVVVTFLPILFIGQVIALVRLGRLHPLAGLAYGVLQWLLLVRADLTSDLTPAIPGYGRLVVCIALLVIVVCRLTGGVVAGRWTRGVANRTYAVFLVHVPVLYVTPHLLSTTTGTTLAFFVATLASAVIADLLYRFVEAPCVRRYRKWENRGRNSAERAPDDLAGRVEATR